MRDLLEAIANGQGRQFTKLINLGFKIDNQIIVKDLNSIQELSQTECRKYSKSNAECGEVEKEFSETIRYLKELNKKANKANGYREMLYYLAIYQNYIVKYKIVRKYFQTCKSNQDKTCNDKNFILANFFALSEDVSKLAYDHLKNIKTDLDSLKIQDQIGRYEN